MRADFSWTVTYCDEVKRFLDEHERARCKNCRWEQDEPTHQPAREGHSTKMTTEAEFWAEVLRRVVPAGVSEESCATCRQLAEQYREFKTINGPLGQTRRAEMSEGDREEGGEERTRTTERETTHTEKVEDKPAEPEHREGDKSD